MPVTAIEGIVENGRIRLCHEVSLPENARVYVIVADLPAQPVARVFSPRLAHPEQAVEFRKQVLEVPSDARL